MHILPIRTVVLEPGMDLATEILKSADIKSGDIIVVSSKAMAICENASVTLDSFTPSDEAKKYAALCNQDPALTEFILHETARMHGRVAGTSPFVLLTELRPQGMKGTILCPNAGVDQSNIASGMAVGWPKDPVQSAVILQADLEEKTGVSVGIIVSDSGCMPARLGVTAFALTCAGLDPVKSEVGSEDLFGKPLLFTQEAIADQLATAANAAMGNAGQSTPAAVIRGHGLPHADFAGWVDGIDPNDDIFKDAFVVR